MPNTRLAAVAYRKNSYHSTTVPAMEAATTRLSFEVGTEGAVGAALTEDVMSVSFGCRR